MLYVYIQKDLRGLSCLLGVVVAILLLAPGPAKAQSFSITEGISGSWYDPTKAGQGYTIQVISEESALLTWFTFDTQGNQLWMQGVGDIDGNQLVFEDLLRFEGPRFGPDFEPDDLVSISSGSLTIEFSSCNQGLAEYSGSSELPADILEIERLTLVAGLDCESTAPRLTGVLHEGLSGAWFDPSQNGQGWMIEFLNDELVLIYWFTYDTQGNQRWMLGVGEVEANGFLSADMAAPVGGRFGPSFDPEEVVNEPWGAFGLSHVQCNRAVAAYFEQATQGAEQFQDVSVIVTINGRDPCAFDGGLSRISGLLSAAAHSYVDTSTNNPHAPFSWNNTPEEAQEAGNPATITGFATAEPVGHGMLADSEDLYDAYKMNLVAGQTVQLIMADWDESNPGRNDLDLLLFAPETGQLIASSSGLGPNEFIEITETGSYEVVVHAYSGSSTYTLHVSYAPVPAGFQMMDIMADFAPDEILVDFRKGSDGSALEGGSTIERLSAEIGLDLIEGPTLGPALLRIARDAEQKSASGAPTSQAGTDEVLGRLPYGDYLLENNSVRGRFDHFYRIKALEALGDVNYAHPNFNYTLATNDPRRPEQWHYDQISLPQAWDITMGDSNVLVAVIDSGVAPHPDIEPNVRRDLGLDAVDVLRNLGPVSGAGDDPLDPGWRTSQNSHGTHVAGTIAALAGNARYGVGVAPTTEIMPIRVFDSRGGGASDFVVARGIYWAAGKSNFTGLADPSKRADVINLSLGSIRTCSHTLQEAIDYARQQGIIVIAAAGNETTSRNVSPASCEGVISVSAVNHDEHPAYYSNCGSHVSVAAPGGEASASSTSPNSYLPADGAACREDPQTFAVPGEGVWSIDVAYEGSSRRPIFRPLPGTSMAAPHVAGVAALMKAAAPGLTPEQFEAYLGSGQLTSSRGPSGWDPEFGHGLINARKAVEAAGGDGDTAPASLSTSPSMLVYGETATNRNISIHPLGSEVGSLDGFFQANAPWIVSASPLDVDGDGFGIWEVGIDREGLVDGLYRGTLGAITTTDVEVQVPVEVRVGSEAETGDAGFLYLVAFDALTGTVVDVLGGSGSGGVYSYEVADLVAGNYLLITFSDVGNELIVCGRGNLCGFYPGTGTMEPVVIEPGTDRELGVITVFPDYSGVGENAQSHLLSVESKQAQFGRMLQGTGVFQIDRQVLRDAQMIKGIDESGGSGKMQRISRPLK